jgi:hypothetical protein
MSAAKKDPSQKKERDKGWQNKNQRTACSPDRSGKFLLKLSQTRRHQDKFGEVTSPATMLVKPYYARNALTRFVSSAQFGDMIGEFLPWHRVQVTRGRCRDSQNRLYRCVKSEVPKESIRVA